MFNDDNALAYAGAGVVAGSSIDSNSTRFDMSGYEEVTFFTTILDSVATGVATLKIESNDADSDTGMTPVEDADGNEAKATLTSANNDDLNNKVLSVTVRNPRGRYVQGVRTSATANIAYGEIHCIRSKPRKAPVDLSSTIGDETSIVAG